jgi:hypothetical protein
MLTTKNVLADQNADNPELRRIVVFEAEPGEVEAKVAQFSSDAIVEPEIKYYPVPVLFSHTFPSDEISRDLRWPGDSCYGTAGRSAWFPNTRAVAYHLREAALSDI